MSHETLPTRSDLFPVNAESVNSSLDLIAEDPRLRFKEESALANLGDPNLARYIDLFSSLNPNNRQVVMEGFYLVRFILRQHAAVTGNPTPILSNDVVNASFASMVEDSGDETFKDAVLREFQELKDSDPEMGRAITEISKYRTDRFDFIFGAINAYSILKRAHIAERLSDDFKF